MAQSRLIELSYFDPHTSIRLTTYADTIVYLLFREIQIDTV